MAGKQAHLTERTPQTLTGHPVPLADVPDILASQFDLRDVPIPPWPD